FNLFGDSIRDALDPKLRHRNYPAMSRRRPSGDYRRRAKSPDDVGRQSPDLREVAVARRQQHVLNAGAFETPDPLGQVDEIQVTVPERARVAPDLDAVVQATGIRVLRSGWHVAIRL